MDRIISEEMGLLMDLEIGSENGTNQRTVFGKRQDKNLLNTVGSGFPCSDRSDAVEYCGESSEVAGENVHVFIGSMNSGGEESGEKRKKTKHKKPPRPPKGPSLDNGDIKLVEQMSMIAMKKRARTKRLKAALMEMKEFKKKSVSSSSPSSLTSGTSLLALAITILFFVIILFQGTSENSDTDTYRGVSGEYRYPRSIGYGYVTTFEVSVLPS